KKSIYLKERIEDQYNWYTRKSTYNKRMAKKWSLFIVSLYILALLFSFYNIFYHSLFIFPVAVLTTLASAFIGWSQIKRYEELQASYLLTAGEILGIKEQVHYISNDSQLSSFVRDAELAFSREHTQWTARRSSS
ncbi:SLATT domain-containing protein, partial [Proteus mirabilis]|nr:SLATT domain-containing protein [Proteus mirabilis]HEK2976025.1 SLATT domain-containing protein [Proteus mirabilis]